MKKVFNCKKVERAIGNKKGFSYVPICAAILVVMLFVAVAIQYAYVYHIAREQQNETQLKLDSYVTRCAVNKYDALKQGEPWDKYIDRNELVDGAYSLLGFPRIITLEYREFVAVDGKYMMSRPNIGAMAGDAFGVLVDYEITIPFELLGREVAKIRVPIKIVSQFKQK